MNTATRWNAEPTSLPRHEDASSRVWAPAEALPAGPYPVLAMAAWIALLAVAAAIYATLASAQTSTAEPQRLEDIVVLPPPSFESEDALLRLMLERSTPCLGCDAPLRQGTSSDRLFDYLVLGMPREIDDAWRFATEVRRLDEGPALELMRMRP